MTDDEELRTAGALLATMTGKGVYDVAMLDERFSSYGFTYNRATGKLHFANGFERLHAATRTQMERMLARDPEGGVMAQNIPDGVLMFDALDLSRAIHKLFMPGQPVPGDESIDRSKAFRANVDSILAYEAIKDPHTREH